jgi:rhodanese-related sulfurtransferase
MVFLKNAKYFDTVQHLNEDLERRNAELEKTIAELTEAKTRITALEKAKKHLKSILNRESERIGRATAMDYFLIIAMSIFVGVIYNFSSPKGIPLLPDSLFKARPAGVDARETRKLMDEGNAFIIDARPQEYYSRKHIKGAVNVPPALFDIMYMMHLSNVDPNKKLIVYGRNISKHYDDEVAHRLTQRDHQNVRVLSGGLSAWQEEGYPVEQ